VSSSADKVREKALSDLEHFIRLVHPQRVLGQCHKDLIRWWTRQDAKSHQLVLLPRDHQKSALVAYRVAWEITKNPALRVLYISSTSNLAVKQLGFIKEILTSDIYRFYWPEMVALEEAKRTKWTEGEISVDHPLRKQEAVRDPTVFTAGLTTNITGLHCDIAVLDDVVVGDNAYTEDGREKVKTQASYLASILGTDSRLWAVGTRYHPKDLYNDFAGMLVELRNEDGEVIEAEPLYEVWQQEVENRGDGTGQYLWPRQQRPDGKWFGFDQRELAKKKAQYTDATQFRAQYYNNPNDLSTASITPDMFQYYNPKLLWRDMGKWYYKHSRLNVFAAIDFAYSLTKKADFSCVVVIGVDSQNNYYVLDIDRFKTNQVSQYFDRILRLHTKWDFRKIRVEVTAAQEVIVEELKLNYIRPHGLALTLDPHRPTRHEGSKEERMEAILQPKYANRQVWHYTGGNCSFLEEELVLQKPPHDDIKDSLANAMDSAVPPSYQQLQSRLRNKDFRSELYHPRFGGIA
jgi:hypothetical protein